ncbi:TSC22 domain family protein 2 isoform X2 [Neophocaena asiaeorientalis asiaeorientalis]|uniref:TSC22 domain family protein 2 isoform X2 n=1 Tax=Neophocaena asiaeorientalis asiaeorientalis TaxID=1706337 RepID=A0A341DDJ4_NEOAA|nr:TSC22 domain family protein 2 isoform X2 [Neophocaena asiaeorientalis asiaeorientalis]
MSKMPAKKKSCFQITSVTTAQVATSITEDTESLDDPDESRTEDVSSEIFDVSRATDYGPEEVCERSSSEETLNNVGDAETPGTVSPNLVLDGQLAAAAATPANGGGAASARSVAGALASTLAAAAPSAPSSGAPGAPPVAGPSAGPGTAAPSQPPTTCSSRFRVIKLDHGSGEPYRRGRWTCMEYYERDSDSSVLTRSGDCIRHSNTFDQAADRDSGLGATGGSVVVVVASMPGAHGPDSGTDSSLTAVSQLPPSEKMSQPAPAPPQSFGVGQPQPQPPPVGGAVAPSSAPLPPFPGAAAGPPQMMAAPPPSQPQGAAPGSVPPGPNGQGLPLTNVTLAQPGLALPPQPGPAVGASAAPPPQQFAYPQAQIPPGHLLPVQPAGQSEYLQPHVAGLQPPSPAQPSSAGAESGLVPAGAGQSQPAPPPQMGGSGAPSAVPGGPHAVVPGVPNVPAAAPAPSVPSVSTTSVTMPNVPAPLAQAQQLGSHPPVSRSGSIIQHVGLPLAPGTASAPTSLPQSDLSQFQTQTQPLVGQVDDTRRKSEPLPQPPLSLIAEIKPVVKPPVADALANPLQLTPMNSLSTSVFSIAIPVDGDEDRNPSTAFFQAFHLNTIQESKNLWDSASGGGGVAIDNKIEQAMDLVKSHLMYAVREEVEVLKEQIKELVERNSLLERENALLKSLSNNDQLSQLPAQQANAGSTSQQQAVIAQPPQPTQPPQQPNVSSA